MMGWWATPRDAAGTGQVALDDVLAVVDRLGQMPQAAPGSWVFGSFPVSVSW
jgi:hypothetical protein